MATAISTNNIIYAATLTTGVSVGSNVGTIPLVAAQAPASLAGEVTTSTGTAAAAADISLSALQSATVGTNAVVFTVPLTAQSSGTASLATAAGASCAANTNCAAYTLQVPGAPANAGAFSAGGTTWAQATAATVDYTVEADAFVPSSGGTTDCNPAVETTSQTSASAALSAGPGIALTVATLAFSGCQ
ncbi:MAG: hypothetical protein ACTHJX_11070 [Terriglobales bacterium]